MARVAKGTREKIQAAVRKQLFESGNDAFSMRAIAAEAGVSAGTIYNHFPDKDALIASIMIDDWHTALKKIESCTKEAISFTAGIREIYNAITEFIRIYEGIWRNYSNSGNYMSVHNWRHRELIGQIQSHAVTLLQRFAPGSEDTSRLLSEMIMIAATRKDITCDELLRFCRYIAA